MIRGWMIIVAFFIGAFVGAVQFAREVVHVRCFLVSYKPNHRDPQFLVPIPCAQFKDYMHDPRGQIQWGDEKR